MHSEENLAEYNPIVPKGQSEHVFRFWEEEAGGDLMGKEIRA